MAIKNFYHDIDLLNVSQLVGSRLHNLDAAAMATLGGTLGAGNQGLVVYNTTDSKIYTWNGASFDSFQIDVVGDIKFAGVINPVNSAAIATTPGFQYAVDTAGTLATVGVTYLPNANVEIGDQVLFADATTAYVIQRNVSVTTETLAGIIMLATQAEVDAGLSTGPLNEAVTPRTLQVKLDTQFYVKQFFDDAVPLVADVATTVSHDLNLLNQDAFTFNVMDGNAQVSVEVHSVDANTLTITSAVAVAAAVVTVQGASVAIG